jgi:microcystin-dependent protein
MDNGDKVPDKTSPNVVSLIDSGGGSAGRVNASTASILGNAAGYEQVSLDLSKIPQHKHNLTGSNGGQYYVTNTKTEAPTDENSAQGNSAVSTVKGQSLSTTGNIDTNVSLGQPVSIMNPYLAINYIIYSGVFS